jgi:hypothetical protein
MSDWRIFPERAWTPVGGVLSGFGRGEGSYGVAYAIEKSVKPFLNGRVSAYIHIAEGRPISGSGVICRASELRSFAAFYVLSDDAAPNLYSVRLAAFKYGKLNFLAGLKDSVLIPNRQFHISLQFFSGEMVGQIVTDIDTHTLKYVLPDPPFPGNCGVVRFYGSSATAQNINIEEIAMKPILPDEENGGEHCERPFCVFMCHSSSDKETVSKVAQILTESGIPYWVDHEQITFGDGIVAKIEDGLKKSRFVVVCLSDNLAASGWCRAEYSPILYREFSGDTSRRVIPLSLDGSKNSDTIPLLLSDKMRADFTDKKSFSDFIRFLRDAMREKG